MFKDQGLGVKELGLSCNYMDLLYITWLQNSGKLFSATKAHPCGVPARAQGFECRVEGLGFKNQGFGRPKLDSRDAMNINIPGPL